MVNESRVLHAEMLEGLTDGLVRKMNPDRGGSITPDQQAAAAAVYANQFVPWVREWSPSAMLEAQAWAEARIASRFG